jgi:hypothetical protein
VTSNLTPSNRAKTSTNISGVPVRPLTQLLLSKCITTEGGGSMTVMALLLLGIFGLAAIIVLSLSHPAFAVGTGISGGAAVIASMIKRLIRK